MITDEFLSPRSFKKTKQPKQPTIHDSRLENTTVEYTKMNDNLNCSQNVYNVGEKRTQKNLCTTQKAITSGEEEEIL